MKTQECVGRGGRVITLLSPPSHPSTEEQGLCFCVFFPHCPSVQSFGAEWVSFLCCVGVFFFSTHELEILNPPRIKDLH